jgi:uncharacterized protein (TIGR03790 family)
MTWMTGVWLELSFFVMVTRLNFRAYFCMAKQHWQIWRVVGAACWFLAACGSALGQVTEPEPAASAVTGEASGATPRALVVRAPRVIGRVQASALGLVINTADPYSVDVGEYYRRARQIPSSQVLRIDLPVQARLSVADLERLRRRIDEHFEDRVQALALAWTQPYAVDCQSITAAVTLGFDAQYCLQACGRGATSPLFNSATSAPFKDLGLRPSMLLASRDTEQARRLIDRGVAADRTLGKVGAVPVQAHFMASSDKLRNVRTPLFPPPGLQRRLGLENVVERGDLPRDTTRVVLVQTGVAQFQGAQDIDWVPGALADHLTSFGGQTDRAGGQSTVLDWLEAGATASHGTVSEPCNYLQKFPHPQLLLLHYLQGSSALEAYWKSVAWPRQGLFVGEPLAAPFSRQ